MGEGVDGAVVQVTQHQRAKYGEGKKARGLPRKAQRARDKVKHITGGFQHNREAD